MLADVYQQILFPKDLHNRRQYGRDDLQRRRRGCDLCYEDAGVVVFLVKQLCKVLDVLDTDVGLVGEFDMYRANLRLRLRLPRTDEWCVFRLHSCRGARGKGHFRALGKARVVGVVMAELVKRDIAFFFREFVALFKRSAFTCATCLVVCLERRILDRHTSASSCGGRAIVGTC